MLAKFQFLRPSIAMEKWSRLARSHGRAQNTLIGQATLENAADETGREIPAEPTELVIVEGKSAADAFEQVRNRKRQSLYVLQGKIPNPARHNRKRLQQHAQLGPLLELLAIDTKPPACDYIILLQDADIDGQHNAWQLSQFFARYLPDWIDQQRLLHCAVPLARIVYNADKSDYVYNEKQLNKVITSMPEQFEANNNLPRINRFKGVASFNSDERATLFGYPLHSRCSQISFPPS